MDLFVVNYRAAHGDADPRPLWTLRRSPGPGPHFQEFNLNGPQALRIEIRVAIADTHRTCALSQSGVHRARDPVGYLRRGSFQNQMAVKKLEVISPRLLGVA